MNCRDDETIDGLYDGSLRVIQARDGYRSSLDPILLSSFVTTKSEGSLLDLGTGNGVIPLVLARQRKAQSIIGVDCQAAMVERAQRNAVLNGFEDTITFLHEDIRTLPVGLSQESFDAVVTNPPYRAIAAGRVSPVNERAIARHELTGTLVDFLRAAAFLLKDGGRFFIVYLADRMAELLVEMRSFRLEPKRLRMVHPRFGMPARMVLVEGRKKGKVGMVIETPIIVYDEAGRDYTEEVLAMYGMNETRDGVRGT